MSYIVVLKEGTSNEVRDAVVEGLKERGAQITHVYDIFPGFAGVLPPAAVAWVQAHETFSSIEADGIVQAL